MEMDGLLEIREAQTQDLDGLLGLYQYLHDEAPPQRTAALEAQWQEMVRDVRHHILMAFEDTEPVGSCVLVVVPNLTRGARPYAVLENVVTHPGHRRKGVGSALLEQARAVAQAAGCYKIMLMTGRKDADTLRFYRQAGYNCRDKTAFLLKF